MVRITVVATLLVTDVSLGGGGGGDTMPPEPICPARAETASNKLRTVATHTWRKVFMCSSITKFLCNPENFAWNYNAWKVSCKSGDYCVRFARRSSLHRSEN